MKKIALIIFSEGLEYDDRVRKEVLSIQKLFPEICFKIFVLFDNGKNVAEEGITSYGVPYKSYKLITREVLKGGRFKYLKTIEFTLKVLPDIKKYDAIWCGEIATALFLKCVRRKPLLWDLHELPMLLLGSSLRRSFLRHLFSKCSVVLHANQDRIEYLKSRGVIKNIDKHYALRNYPNFYDVDKEYDEKYYSFVEWKANKECVYLQGLFAERRAPFETISAVLDTGSLAAVVVGSFDKDILERLLTKYGEDEISNRIFFAGKIPQLKIPQYVSKCSFSMVFYKHVNANNIYCEANRFYQSLLVGVPVICGNNPPMKRIIEEYGCGVCINDDGNSVDEIKIGIQTYFERKETILKNVDENKNCFLWDSQNEIIKAFVKKYLKYE